MRAERRRRHRPRHVAEVEPSLIYIGSGDYSVDLAIKRPYDARLIGAPVEQVINANSHHLNVAIVGGDYVAHGGGRESGWDRERLIAQTDIIVFHPRRPIVGESPFETGARRPAGVGIVVGERDRGAGRVCQRQVVAADPGTAAFTVEQHAIPSVTEPAGQRGEPSAVIATRKGRASGRHNGHRIIVVGEPIKVALDADNEAAAKLVVGTHLATADKRRIVIGIEIKEPEAVSQSAVLPACAEIAAEIEPGPTECGRDDRRRLVGWCRRDRQVGRSCSHAYSQKKNRDCSSAKQLLHGATPIFGLSRLYSPKAAKS
jgi:hypothetical protein